MRDKREGWNSMYRVELDTPTNANQDNPVGLFFYYTPAPTTC